MTEKDGKVKNKSYLSVIKVLFRWVFVILTAVVIAMFMYSTLE